jgi:putative transposase
MQLSQIGEIVREEWLNTAVLRPDMNLELGEFVVMPNHFHALIHIGVNEFNQTRQGKLMSFPLEQDYPEWKNTFGAQRKNLASIIRGFKSKVTSRVRREKALPLFKTNEVFAWKESYYDRIMKSKDQYERTKYYIRNNVKNWGL